jgi:hypothetical protein
MLNALHPGKINETTKASQAEALAGADNRKYMTPLRTKQVVDVVVDDVVEGALPAAIDTALAAASPVFDDVLSVASVEALPNPGVAGKLYIVGKLSYHWNGTAYDQLGVDNTDDLSEGTTNLYFTEARAAAAAPVQSVAGKAGAVTLATTDISGLSSALDAKQGVRTTQSFQLQEGDNYLPSSRNTLYLLSGSFTFARIYLPTYLPSGTGPWIGDRIRILWVGVKANANSRIVVNAFAGDGQYPALAHLHAQDQAAEFVLDNRPVNASGQLTWRSDVSPIRWVQPPATPTSAVAPNGGVYSPSDVAFDGSYFYIYGKKPDGSPVWLRSPIASTW